MEEPNTVEVVIQDIAKSIFYLKKQKGLIDKQAEELKIESSKLDAQITKLESDLLNGMKFFGDIQEFQVDDIVSTRFKRDNIGYTSDADVLNYLKEKYAGQYIKSKLTESLDKTALKKAIKTDPVL